MICEDTKYSLEDSAQDETCKVPTPFDSPIDKQNKTKHTLNECKHFDFQTLPCSRITIFWVNKRNEWYCEASLIHFGAIELCENDRVVGLLTAEIIPSLTRTNRLSPEFIPPIWQCETSSDTLILDINGAPVTNREGIPLDGFQRPPNIDNQDSVSEETVEEKTGAYSLTTSFVVDSGPNTHSLYPPHLCAPANPVS